MSELEFLSPDRARAGGGFDPIARSPLDRALPGAGAGRRDLSMTGKIEVRGDVGGMGVPETAELVRISPRRALVLCSYPDTAALREELCSQGRVVVDLTGALAGIAVRGERAMRRLTDLDLEALPAVGKVAGAPAVVLRDGDEFRVFVPQELGHHVAVVTLDAEAVL